MSAWICSPEHFGLLAAFAARRHCATILPADAPGINVRLIAEELARECIRSVTCRYPDDADGSRPGPAMRDAEIIREAGAFAVYYRDHWPVTQTDWHIKCHARCYSYQSCETDEWPTTAACRQNDAILATVEGAPAPRPEPFVWGFDDDVTRRILDEATAIAIAGAQESDELVKLRAQLAAIRARVSWVEEAYYRDEPMDGCDAVDAIGDIIEILNPEKVKA